MNLYATGSHDSSYASAAQPSFPTRVERPRASRRPKNVPGPAGITIVSGASIRVDGTLNITSTGVSLTLDDVDSESLWRNQIRLGNTSGPTLRDNDNFGAGTGGVHKTCSAGPSTCVPTPKLVGTVTQDPGTANIRFYRTSPSLSVLLVANGVSPDPLPGFGDASLAFAYLSTANQIVSAATNRVPIMLDDSGAGPDDNHDDYVGILVANGPAPVPLPPAAWLLGSGLPGLLALRRRRAAIQTAVLCAGFWRSGVEPDAVTPISAGPCAPPTLRSHR